MRLRVQQLLLAGAMAILPLTAAVAQEPIDRYQVLLMTMGPGAAVYERFGHNAIVIRDTVAGRDWVYNYGSFDFAAPGFVGRFIEGRPRYWLAVDDWEHTLQSYTYFQRRVEVQELALRPEQKAELAFRLSVNAQPEHREYLYDYFRDNCSTRVRDMLDQILGGSLGGATHGASGEGTLRFHMARSLTNDIAMYLGILTAMGPTADQPLDQWDEMFLPEKLQARVRELRVADPTGRMVPLVTREATVVDVDVYHVEAAPPDRALRFFGVGLLLAALIMTGAMARGAGVFGRLVAGIWAVIAGLGGVVLLYLWLGTNHLATAHNWNLLTLSPLSLLLPVALLWPRRSRWAGAVAAVVGAMSLLGLIMAHLPGITHQVNLEPAMLTFPPTFAAAVVVWLLNRRRATAPPSPR
ncbi:MAG: DUF4105 domain-containing protein [Gemmatimonadota bacterium]